MINGNSLSDAAGKQFLKLVLIIGLCGIALGIGLVAIVLGLMGLTT